MEHNQEQENELNENIIGIIDGLSRHDREKPYRMTVYKLGAVLLINLILLKLLPYVISYIFLMTGFYLNTGTNLGYLITWLINDILVYASPIVPLYFVFKNEKLSCASLDGNNSNISFKNILIVPFFFVAYFAMISGNIITEFISTMIYNNFGVGQTTDVFAALWPKNAFQSIVFYFMIVIAAPVAEELIFRKMIFRQLQKFGNYTAIFLTALLFGLFHGNLTQFLYAFMGGIILGFAAVWSGSVKIPIILHMLINGFEVLRTEIYSLVESNVIAVLIINIVVYTVITAGAISLIVMIVKKMFKLKSEFPVIPKNRKAKVLFLNPLFALALAAMIFNLFI